MTTDTLSGKHVHLVGIGGSGMSSIAVVLKERGVFVSGSDQQASQITRRLEEIGVVINLGHHPENISGADLVVRSSAVRAENVEVLAALQTGIPVFKRETFLPQLIGSRQTIAIAGTHGKTTTTALIAYLLSRMGSDPSYIIGGYSPDLGGSAHAGDDDRFVIEADEYDHMFLGLHPQIAVVTSIEHDHPDFYPTQKEYMLAFKTFLDGINQSGVLLACLDDPGSAELLNNFIPANRRTLGYSTSQKTADYFADQIRANEFGGCTFSLFAGGDQAVDQVQLRIPGIHNVSNALASLGVMDILGFSLADAAQQLLDFQGTGRRFEIRGEPNQILLIDDYAHHPTEIRATLAAARLRYPDRKIWVVWQPHTYTRTRTLLSGYSKSFESAAHLIVTSIFPAREQPPSDGFSSLDVVAYLNQRDARPKPDIFFEPDLQGAASMLLSNLAPRDVLLVLSAGNANWINTFLLEELSKC